MTIWKQTYCLTLLLFFGLSVDANESVFELSLAELLEIKVSVLSKTPQRFIDSPRAVYVITADDIRRSGHTSVPEALRLAPGVHVAQITAHRWAISIRGFQQEFAGKLLVLLDGKTLYTPTYSGVHWDAHDLPIELVERIEIVRGPATVSWGANAMNGVINIVTKKAQETQGVFVSALAGNLDTAVLNAWYGAETGDWNWRVASHFADRNDYKRDNYSSSNLDSTSLYDQWSIQRLGFRADRKRKKNNWTIDGDIYQGDIHDLGDNLVYFDPLRTTDAYIDGEVEGYSLNSRWQQETTQGDTWQWQFYLDENSRHEVNIIEERRVYDLSAQYSQKKNQHTFTYGLAARAYQQNYHDNGYAMFYPEKENSELYTVFIHDKWALNSQWSITAGANLESDEFTGEDIQPAFGLAYKNNAIQVWTSYEQAIRRTNRLERGVVANVQAIEENSFYPGQPEGAAQLRGQQELEQEELNAYELGLKYFINDNFYWDIAAYYFDYDELIFFESSDGAGDTFFDENGKFVLPLYIRNSGFGTVKGLEWSFAWQAHERLQIKGGYTYTKLNLQGDSRAENIMGETPENQAHLRFNYNPANNWEWDAALYYVDALPGFNSDFTSYLRMDTRIAWQFNQWSELVIALQNITDDEHYEHNEKGFSTYAEIPRGYYLQLKMRFP